MRRSALAALVILSLAHAAYAQTAPAPSTGTPLIERAKLFGNPSKMAGNVSPDGKWLSWIAPRDGVLNVWVAPIGSPGDAKPLTDEKTRPIRMAFWAPDSKTLLFINDKGGDEKLITVPVDSTFPYYSDVGERQDLPSIIFQQIEHFFTHYKDLEPDKWVRVGRWGHAEEARRILLEAIERAKTPEPA